jgi:hypothetical protein
MARQGEGAAPLHLSAFIVATVLFWLWFLVGEGLFPH